MSENLYVMRYSDGSWVQRDDSTGPMSTGGYPSPVKSIRRATVWTSKMEALKYRHVCRSDGPWTLHQLEMSTRPELITPGEEAEASGDKEYEEFKRLAKKFAFASTGKCPFVEAWVGTCNATPELGEVYCSKHKKEKCFQCGAQATRNCDQASQFVCGVPMCDDHNHH